MVLRSASQRRRLLKVATVPISPTVYRTERGLILRIIEASDGGLKVELLKSGAWVAGRIGMVGLRLSPTTTKLTLEETKGLPA
jgi:hypothetical protein